MTEETKSKRKLPVMTSEDIAAACGGCGVIPCNGVCKDREEWGQCVVCQKRAPSKQCMICRIEAFAVACLTPGCEGITSHQYCGDCWARRKTQNFLAHQLPANPATPATPATPAATLATSPISD